MRPTLLLRSAAAPNYAKSLEYATNLVRRGDSDAIWPSHFYPSSIKPAYLALRALNIELATIDDDVSNPMVGRIRYQWWKDALKGTLEVCHLRDNASQLLYTKGFPNTTLYSASAAAPSCLPFTRITAATLSTVILPLHPTDFCTRVPLSQSFFLDLAGFGRLLCWNPSQFALFTPTSDCSASIYRKIATRSAIRTYWIGAHASQRLRFVLWELRWWRIISRAQGT